MDRKPGDKRDKLKAKAKHDSFGKGDYQEQFPQLGASSNKVEQVIKQTKPIASTQPEILEKKPKPISSPK